MSEPFDKLKAIYGMDGIFGMGSTVFVCREAPASRSWGHGSRRFRAYGESGKKISKKFRNHLTLPFLLRMLEGTMMSTHSTSSGQALFVFEKTKDFLSTGMPKMKIKRISPSKKTIKNSYGL
ncbi:MAG TPA: hypothetical protein VFH95_05005 [Candidatus Kapabacteria bacterium]|nr:hypothetical protein [Candidatus Kapabacteria bacterium]